MASKSILPVLATLCLLLVPAAQGKEDSETILVIHGTARCQSNASRIISNATLYLMINKVRIPGTDSRTTNTGEVLIAVRLNSTEQVAFLMSKKALLVAPPDACGALKLPVGTVLAAEVQPNAMLTVEPRSSESAGGGDTVRVQRRTVGATDGDALLHRIINDRLQLHATNDGDAGSGSAPPAIAASDGLLLTRIILGEITSCLCRHQRTIRNWLPDE